MLDRLLNQVNRLERGLDAVWLNNDVIAGNLANADTPGYKAQYVDFSTAFQEALADRANYGAAAQAKPAYQSFLDARPASAHSKSAMPEFKAQRRTDTSLRLDENNVDIDQQMAELAKNSILYEALTYSVSKELGRIKLVINEGR